MLGAGGRDVGAPVEGLARALGADAWRLALVAGADPAAATRAALHALVIGAVDGGEAAERAAVLALARSWALDSPGAGRGATVGGAVVDAFWSLDEGLRSALWCTDRLGMDAADASRVSGSAAAGAATVARGRIRRAVSRQQRDTGDDSPCAPVAHLLAKVVAGHAPAAKAARVSEHASGCASCAHLLSALGDPTAAVEASLPAAPDLVAPALRAWRDHVGAPHRSVVPVRGRWSDGASRHHRPVVAMLALVTAGTFGAATSLLAASPDLASPLPVLAAPMFQAPSPPASAPAPVVRRQVVIPPLADDVVVDPGLARFVTRDLAEVTPGPPLPPPAPAPPPIAAVAPQPAPVPAALIAEPPPAVAQPWGLDLDLPLPVLLPLSVNVERNCASLKIGPLRLALPCEADPTENP